MTAFTIKGCHPLFITNAINVMVFTKKKHVIKILKNIEVYHIIKYDCDRREISTAVGWFRLIVAKTETSMSSIAG